MRQFINSRNYIPPKPINFISSLLGDVLCDVEESAEVHKGLLYSDFSAKSLIDAGATEYLKSRSSFQSSPIDNIDMISKLEKSDVTKFADDVLIKSKVAKAKKDEILSEPSTENS